MAHEPDKDLKARFDEFVKYREEHKNDVITPEKRERIRRIRWQDMSDEEIEEEIRRESEKQKA